METQVIIRTFREKNYFTAKNHEGILCYFQYIPVEYIVGKDTERLYSVEFQRNKSIILAGNAWKSSVGPTIFHADYTDLVNIPYSCFLYPETLCASYFEDGDELYCEIPCGLHIANCMVTMVSFNTQINQMMRSVQKQLAPHVHMNFKQNPNIMYGFEVIAPMQLLAHGMWWN